MTTPVVDLGNYAEVFAATPEGLETAGGLYIAPVGTPLPTDVDEPLDDAFGTLGYVSTDGVSITIDGSTTPIEVWSGAEIGSLREKFAIDYSAALLQVLSARVNAFIFGSGNVSTAAATAQHGNRIKTLINSRMPDRFSFVLDAFFEDKAIRQVAELVQVSEIGDITLVHSAPMMFEPTWKVYRGSDGNHIVQYGDDGQKLAA